MSWIASGLGGSSAKVFGVSVYGASSEAWWHKAMIRPAYRVFYRLDRIQDWFLYRLHPKHRYHLVDTGLEPGYYDADELMLHACFSLLCRYVERGMGGDIRLEHWAETLKSEPDKNAPAGWQVQQGELESEAVVLYRWWKVKRPADIKRKEELLHHLYSGRRGAELFVDDEETGLKRYQPPKWEDSEDAMHAEMRALEETIDREEQEMLHRLIDIRGGLWT